MVQDSKPRFFYAIPREETTKAESIAEKFSLYCSGGGFLILMLYLIFAGITQMSPAFEIMMVGWGMMFLGAFVNYLVSEIKSTKNAKKIRRYSPEFNTTISTQVIEFKIEYDDSEDDKEWGYYFYLYVKNPKTQKRVCFCVAHIQKHLGDCQKISDTYASTKAGFEVTIKLHSTDENAVCLVLNEETSPYLRADFQPMRQ